MKKRKSAKNRRVRNYFQVNPLVYSPLFLIIASIIGLLMVAKVVVFLAENRVLGSQTLIAHGGSDDEEDEDGDRSGSGSGASGSSNSGSRNSGEDSKSREDKDEEKESDETKEPESKDNLRIIKGWINPKTRLSIERENERENEDSGVRFRTQTKEDESKTDIRLSENERIRTRSKDGRTRIDITAGGIKTRLEYRDDRVIIKAEQEDGTEVELEDDTLLKIDERLAKDSIKIASAGGERFFLQRGNMGAVTEFPLSIDLATNTLFVKTPAGEKAVTVLPEQAIQNMIASNVVNRLGGQAIVDAVSNNTLTSVEQIITLGEVNDILVYEINGISDQKLLGFIPIAIDKEIVVSAETGEVVSADVSSALDRVLDLLSF